MRKQWGSFLLAMTLAAGLAVPASATGSTFSDVPTSYWAYPYIQEAVSAGWIAGYDNGTFGVNDQVTYAQLYTMIAQSFFADKVAAYNGPKENWAQPYVAVCTKMGIASLGIFLQAQQLAEQDIYSTAFNGAVTRAEMAELLNKTLYKLGVNITYDKDQVAASIPDKDVAYQSHEESILSCVAAGVISGVDDKGTFSGSSRMTRAQAAVVMYRMHEVVESGGPITPSNPSQPPEPGTSGSGLGQKLSSGATAAAGVKSSIGKNDAYPTYGNSSIVSPNGYFTGATNVDIGNAQLVYELLNMVNEARVAEGHAPLQWVQSDAAEEHTLQRCNELVAAFTHERPKGKFSDEVIARGQTTAAQVCNDWMNSPGHKQTLMYDGVKYLSAAKVGSGYGSYWIICVWTDVNIENVEQFSVNNYDESYLYH